MSVDTLEWASLTSVDLLLSLRGPEGWDVRVVDETRFGIFRDPADEDGYRANVTFLLGEPEEGGIAWFRAFCAAVPTQLAASLPEFELLGTDDFRSSSNAYVFAVRYRQQARGVPPTSHLQAYVWADSHRMYVVSGSTLRAHEQRDLPVFDAVVRSLRLLPPRE